MLKDHVLKIEQAKLLKDDILNNLYSPELFGIAIEFYWVSIKDKDKFKLVDNQQMKYYNDHCDYYDDEYDYYPALMVDEFIDILLPNNVIEKEKPNRSFLLGVRKFYSVNDEEYMWEAEYISDSSSCFFEVDDLFCKDINLLNALVGLYDKYKEYEKLNK